MALTTIAASDLPHVVTEQVAWTDGVADDVEIQTALDAGHNVLLTAGTFTLAAPLVLRFPGQTVRGAGIDATKVLMPSATPASPAAIVLTVPSGQDRLWGAGVSDLTLADAGIALDRTYFCRLDNLRVLNTISYGVRVYGIPAMFAAYNKLANVSVSGGQGHGIILDAYSENTDVIGCNASYYQSGTIAPSHSAEPATDAGIGLFVRSGNNMILSGHYDRCRVPIYLEFASGNKLWTATDNALDCGVAIKGGTGNLMRVNLGRMDPKEADGVTVNPRYGTRRGVSLVNTAAGNVIDVMPLADNNPPAVVPPNSQRGGWLYHVQESGSAGQPADGGPNTVVGTSPYLAVRMDGGSAPMKTRTANYTVTATDLATFWGADGCVILGDPTAASLTLTLPSGLKPGAYRFTARNVSTGPNVTVIAAGAGDTVAGGSIALTSGQYATVCALQTTNGAAMTWQRVG